MRFLFLDICHIGLWEAAKAAQHDKSPWITLEIEKHEYPIDVKEERKKLQSTVDQVP